MGPVDAERGGVSDGCAGGGRCRRRGREGPLGAAAESRSAAGDADASGAKVRARADAGDVQNRVPQAAQEEP